MIDNKVNDPSMNPRDNTKPLTWEDMKAFYDKLTPEQRQSKLVWWGVEQGGYVESLFQLDEDHYSCDEGAVPASTLDLDNDEEMEDRFLQYKKGHPIIDVGEV